MSVCIRWLVSQMRRWHKTLARKAKHGTTTSSGRYLWCNYYEYMGNARACVRARALAKKNLISSTLMSVVERPSARRMRRKEERVRQRAKEQKREGQSNKPNSQKTRIKIDATGSNQQAKWHQRVAARDIFISPRSGCANAARPLLHDFVVRFLRFSLSSAAQLIQ